MKLLGIVSVFAFVSLPLQANAQTEPEVVSITYSEDTTIATTSEPILVNRLNVPAGVTLTIESGVVIKFVRQGSRIPRVDVSGELIVNGTAEAPVYFTAFQDDSVFGDSNGDGAASTPSPGYWSQILLRPGAAATLKHMHIRYGGYGTGGSRRCLPGITWCRGSLMNAGTLDAEHISITDSYQNAFHILGGTAEVRDAYFARSTDVPIYAQAGTTTISNSSITSDSFAGSTDVPWGVLVNGATVDVRNNWWGDMSGPRHDTVNPAGAGSYVVNTDLVSPWLTADPFATSTEPTGASSVLFLPGIQASRLYSVGVTGPDKVWEPINGNDVRALAMDENGNSLNEIVTEDIIDSIPGLGTVYGDLVNYLDQLVADEVIAEYESYAYDWRYSVSDVAAIGTRYPNDIKKLDQIVQSLAANSKSGKVTIVAHSNGGLLGKVLIDNLVASGDVDLIDNFIMIGTPQLGTPKAIASLLHGTGQGISLKNLITLVSEETAREVARNTPGAYGLLPSEEYQANTPDPLVTFAPGTSTDAFIDAYGTEIDSISSLDEYMTTGYGEAESASEVIQLNLNLLAEARNQQSLLDTWQSPTSITTYSLAGVGVNTIAGLRYESFTERICTLLVFCEDVELYKPVPQYSIAGDETVMALSAAGGDPSIEQYFINLEELSQAAIERDFTHYNFTEAVPVQQFISNILLATTTNIDFISKTSPSLTNENLLLGAHSPVYFYIEDSLGRRTGQMDADTILEEIPGSRFELLGSSRYVVAPKDINFEIYINGYEEGGMTLTITDLAQPEQPFINVLPVKVVTASTTVTAVYESQVLQNLQVDEDGDGLRDYQITSEGLVIAELAVSYSVVRDAMKNRLDRRVYDFLVGLLNLAERFSLRSGWYAHIIEYRLLSKLSFWLEHLYRNDFIEEADYTVLLKYVRELQNNISQ